MHRAIRWLLNWRAMTVVTMAIVLTIAYYVHKGAEKQKAEADARQTHRETGKVNPTESVDPSKAPKERVLSQQQVQPITPTAPPTPGMTPAPSPRPSPVPQVQGTQLASYVYWEQPAPTPTPSQEVRRAKPEPRYWLRTGTEIPCQLVDSIDTSHMNVMARFMVTMPVHESCDGRDEVVIPAGSLIVAWASSKPTRDRVEVAGKMIMSFFDGRELSFDGYVEDREVADLTMRQFGPEDGTPGLPGILVDSDRWASFRALVKMLLMTGVQATQGVAIAATEGALGGGRYGGGGSTTVQMPDTTPLLAEQLDQIFEGKRDDDKRYLHVPASTECYVVTTSKVWPEFRHIAGQESDEQRELVQEPEKVSADPVERALNAEEKILKQISSQQQPQPQEKAHEANESKAPRFHFN